MPPDDWLFSTTWIHVFEEDSGAGAVYRPDGGPVPLSRRPRRRLTLREDGSALLYEPGPDDRYVEQRAEWTARDDEIIVQAEGGRQLRIVSRSPERLVVVSSS